MVTLAMSKVTGTRYETTDLEVVYAYHAADDDGTWPSDDSHDSFLCDRSIAYAPTLLASS